MRVAFFDLRRKLLAALASTAAGVPALALAARNPTAPTPSAPADASAPPAAASTSAERATVGLALPAPSTGRWRFGVHYGGHERGLEVAVLDYRIEHDGRRYRIESTGRAEGLAALVYSGVMSQRSEGLITRDGLRPERYWEQRGKRPERWAQLDHAAGQVVFSARPPVPLVAGVQDRLSVPVQLGLLARAAPDRVAAGQTMVLPELGSSRIDSARYLSHGKVMLQTAGGALAALHLERVAPRDADDARVDVWLGYDRDMLPVRLRFIDPDGRVLDQLIRPD